MWGHQRDCDGRRGAARRHSSPGAGAEFTLDGRTYGVGTAIVRTAENGSDLRQRPVQIAARRRSGRAEGDDPPEPGTPDQPVGRGQVVAFAEDPNYRAYSEATQLLFMNAVLLGQGR